MSHFASVVCSRFALRLALIGASAGALAGCAGSERLSDPFSNPFQTSQATDPAPTSSIAPAPQISAPVTPVQARPLGSPVAAPLAPAAPRPAVASVATPRTPAAPGWTAAGGTPISVQPGETAETIARRYGVPADALVKANGFSSAAQVQPGSRLVIPVYNAAGAAVAQAAPQHFAEAAQKAGRAAAPLPAAHVVAAKPMATVGRATTLVAEAPKKLGETAKAAGRPVAEAQSLGRTTVQAKNEALARTDVAKADALKADAAKKLALAKTETAAAKAELARAQADKAAATKLETAKVQPKVETAKAERVKTEPVKLAKAEAAPETRAEEPEETGAKSAGGPEFRWPARGRIIQNFKPGGNEGINIAVPEGTSVKAAEEGVVAYAGSELKGYGNLVLIRHPNGFVSAYANNSDIEVKRGDTVKRGQVIARSGQSGNVASPQLHFELRKGATPVDPTQYLAGL